MPLPGSRTRRHGVATLAAGVDLRIVQEMLGHSSIVLTADTYTSVLPHVAHAAAEKVAALIVRASCLVPGTRRRRYRQAPRTDAEGPAHPRQGQPGSARRSRAHQPVRSAVPGPAPQTRPMTAVGRELGAC